MGLRILSANNFYKIILQKRYLQFVFLVILSGTVSNLAYPEFNLFFIQFFSLVPLFYVLYKVEKISYAFLFGALYGIVFHFILLFWLKIFHPLSLPAILLGFFLYFGFCFLLCKLFMNYFSELRLLIIPSVWTAIEYIRSIGFLGFPWGLISHSQWNFLPFIQIAEFFGMWIISFLVVLINLLFLEFFLSFKKRYIVATIVIIIVPLLYGIIRIKQVKREISQMNKIRIALIQGNIDPNLNWSDIKYDVLSKFTVLSEKAALHKPDLIVWTETTVLDYLKHYIKNREKLLKYPYLLERIEYSENVVRIAKDLETYIFMGILDFEREIKNGKIIDKDYNAAALVSPKAKIVDVYHKIHLVPFGEWFPYGRYFPFIKKILEQTWAGNFTPGKRKTVFKVFKNNKEFKFSCLICYEGVFSNLTRMFILNGAEFLLNITNDMWSYSRKAEFQHMVADVFRTIENRVPYVRSANSGVTGWINQYGKVVKILPLFTVDYLIIDVPVQKMDNFTFYTRYGNFFPKLLLIFCGIMLALCLLDYLKVITLQKISMGGNHQ